MQVKWHPPEFRPPPGLEKFADTLAALPDGATIHMRKVHNQPQLRLEVVVTSSLTLDYQLLGDLTPTMARYITYRLYSGLRDEVERVLHAGG